MKGTQVGRISFKRLSAWQDISVAQAVYTLIISQTPPSRWGKGSQPPLHTQPLHRSLVFSLLTRSELHLLTLVRAGSHCCAANPRLPHSARFSAPLRLLLRGFYRSPHQRRAKGRARRGPLSPQGRWSPIAVIDPPVYPLLRALNEIPAAGRGCPGRIPPLLARLPFIRGCAPALPCPALLSSPPEGRRETPLCPP